MEQKKSIQVFFFFFNFIRRVRKFILPIVLDMRLNSVPNSKSHEAPMAEGAGPPNHFGFGLAPPQCRKLNIAGRLSH